MENLQGMTRSTIFRVIVAMRLLPNFTAYWWMLPRRMKFIRTFDDLARFQFSVIQARYIQKQWEQTFKVALLLKREHPIETISRSPFRLPYLLSK